METCVNAGGTITGEHGVGLDKSAYLPLVFSEDDMRAMLQVRAAFDPTGLCNPGKIIPVLKGCGEARAVAESKTASRSNGDARDGDGDGQESGRDGQGFLTAALSSSNAVEAAAPSNATAVETATLAKVGVDETASLSVEPASADEVCELLRAAERERLKVFPAGAGLQSELRTDELPARSVLLKTTRMARLVEHEPADLVATAEAGMTLADFNSEVGRSGQWLPLDLPDGATLGGIVATGASGAQALGYGAPRSYVLGMKVALAGGRRIKAGGRVVKNVAGYDLCKLFTGSHGTLGVILEITFKLRPRPRREATLVARSKDLGELVEASRAVAGSQLLPVAVELLSPGMATKVMRTHAGEEFFMLARFAGTEGAVGHQLARAAEIVGGRAKGAKVSGVTEDDGAVWSRLAAAASGSAGDLVWRACVRPSALGPLLSRLGGVSPYASHTMWHAGAGDGRLRVFERIQGDGAGHTFDQDKLVAARLLRELREDARAAGGSLVVERARASFRRSFDSWGLGDSAALLMKRIKEQLDPSNTFSPGRFGFTEELAS
jgi:FAD/FMN-containing dehydrogenase